MQAHTPASAAANTHAQPRTWLAWFSLNIASTSTPPDAGPAPAAPPLPGVLSAAPGPGTVGGAAPPPLAGAATARLRLEAGPPLAGAPSAAAAPLGALRLGVADGGAEVGAAAATWFTPLAAASGDPSTALNSYLRQRRSCSWRESMQGRGSRQGRPATAGQQAKLLQDSKGLNCNPPTKQPAPLPLPHSMWLLGALGSFTLSCTCKNRGADWRQGSCSVAAQACPPCGQQ